MSTNTFLYALPSMVLLFWSVFILLKRKPLLRAHKLGLLFFLILIFTTLLCAINLSSGRCPSFAFIIHASLALSFATPVYFLFMKVLTDIRGVRTKDYLFFIVPFIVIIINVILCSVYDNAQGDLLVKKAIYNQNVEMKDESFYSIAKIFFDCYYIIPITFVTVHIMSIPWKKRYIWFIDQYFSAPLNRQFPSRPIAIFTSNCEIIAITSLPLMLLTNIIPHQLCAVFIVFQALIFFYRGHNLYHVIFYAEQMREKVPSLASLGLDLDMNVSEQNMTNLQDENNINKDVFDENSVLDKGDSVRLSKETLDRIESEQMFLDSNLTLNSLADKLNTNRTYLSQAIRYYYGTNLAQMIKALRIKYAMNLLKDKDYKKSITELAYDSGYLNLATFSRDFQQIAGASPKKYASDLRMKIEE